MNVRDIRIVPFPVELDLGIPYIKPDELAKAPTFDGLSERERLRRFWCEPTMEDQPLAKGLLLLPLSAMKHPGWIPAKNSESADWSHPTQSAWSTPSHLSSRLNSAQS